jgi:hypothetical protein
VLLSLTKKKKRDSAQPRESRKIGKTAVREQGFAFAKIDMNFVMGFAVPPEKKILDKLK